MIKNEWVFEAVESSVKMPSGEEFRPCPECSNHLHLGEKEDECTQWLMCLVCGFDCMQ